MFASLRAVLRSPATWVLLALFVVEFAVFDQLGAHQHTKIYPRWNDQIQYLSEAYQGYEQARTQGFLSGLAATLTNPSAQGTLHDVYALLLFALVGPSRSAALAINVLALLAWQAALYLTLRRVATSPWLALLAALLPLSLAGPWRHDAGSAYDFRLDHLAMCTMGVTLCLALRTDSFRHRRWSVLFGLGVGMTLLTRFLTGTYFTVILLGLLLWAALGRERWQRLLNVALAAGAATALAAPLFWRNREWIWNYYWIGHYVGPESAIRNQNFGLGQSLNFLGHYLYLDHLGLWFVVFAAAITVVLGLPLRRTGPIAQPSAHWFLPALFIFAPLLVLTLHAQKSAVVLGIFAPGVIGLIAALWLHLGAMPRHPLLLPGTALLATALCAGFFLHRQQTDAYDPLGRSQLRRVTTFGPELAARAAAAGLRTPRVAVDYITDALDAQVLRVTTYEKEQRWVPFEMTLPISIAEPTEAEVWSRLERSDFVFLTEHSPTDYYPFERTLAPLRPRLHAWCRTHLLEVEHFTLLGRRMVLYQRREIPLPTVHP